MRVESETTRPDSRDESPYCVIEDRLAGLRAEHRYRFLRRVETAQEARITLDGESVLLFCSNNYLGLANHPDLKAAAS